jgi:hypothetical protein
MRRAPFLVLLMSLVAWSQASYVERYEEWALVKTGYRREPAPEGKQIESIVVLSEDIVGELDPYPRFINWVHAKTREHVIRRELLLKPGDAYASQKAEETERILRALGDETQILAVARIIPIQGSTPDQVSLLVLTKDLWSIRINASFLMVGTLLKQLRIKPTEQNFLGRNKHPSLDFDLQQATLGIGQAYVDPRVLGSGLRLEESASVIFNRQSGQPEGSQGQLVVSYPLRTLEDRWGAALDANGTVRTARLFRGPSIVELPYPDETAPTAFIPYVYEIRSVSAGGRLTRSFGRQYKTDVSVGLAGYSNQYRAPVATALTPPQAEWFDTHVLPYSETGTYLFGGVSAYEARWRIFRNLDTFGLPEDVRLGYRGTLEIRAAPRLLAGSTTYTRFEVGTSYRWALGENLLHIGIGAATRYMPGFVEDNVVGPWVNASALAVAYDATPVIGIGRFVGRAILDMRWNDLTKRRVLLGGGTGLRGAADGALSGSNSALFNFEYRTLPLEILTAQLGAVLFWDAGSAFERTPSFIHTVGVGLRLLIPQFNVSVIRVDFGYVLNGVNPDVLNRISSSMGSAVSLPE